MTDIPKSSPELLAFYREWLAWAESGAPDLRPFDRDTGLCCNASVFDDEACIDLLIQLSEAFLRSYDHPFGGPEQYYAERNSGTMHLNPERLAWVRARIADCEGEEDVKFLR